jgi:positive regulator of sigma E activity
MAAPHQDGDKQFTPPDRSTVILLLGTMADTTWRMFVPILVLLLIGLLLDKQLHTTPWIMTAGLILGTAFAYLLVKQQLKKVRK